MKKITLSIIALLLPAIAFAQSKLTNPVAKIADPRNLIDLLITIIQFIATPIVVIMIILAGFRFVTAEGDERKLTDAKQALIWGLVGATILLGATVLKNVVFNTLQQLQ